MATDIERLIREIQSLPLEDRRRVRQALEGQAAPVPAATERSAEEELQKRLVDAGLLAQLKRPLRDADGFRRRSPIDVQGKPLSESIREERR